MSSLNQQKPKSIAVRSSGKIVAVGLCLIGLTACSGNGESQSQQSDTGSSPPANQSGSTKPTNGGVAEVPSGGSSASRGSNVGTAGMSTMAQGMSMQPQMQPTMSPTAGMGNTGTAGTTAMTTMMPRGSGADAGMEDEDAGVCIPLEKPIKTNFVKCSMDICPAQDSVCVPTNLLTSLGIAQKSIDLLADCTDKYKCVPETLANRGGRVLLKPCRSVNDAEGRCLSSCVPQVAQQKSILPKDVCEGTDLCTPCFDPRTGAETGACDQGCDMGPTEPPKPFPKCCSDRGLCVPPTLAGDQAKNLNRDTCSEGTLCAPAELTDPTYQAKACDSIEGAEGRCLSTCVGGAVAKQKDRLPNAGCSADEVCAPCYDPVTGEDTGACSINGDMPKKPKLVFDPCCGTTGGEPVGVCVPPALAGDQASILRQESCASGKLCAPIKKAQDPMYQFPTCTSLLGTGACVNSCIVDPTQAAILTRSGCAAGELCAPCDLLGTPTGACK